MTTQQVEQVNKDLYRYAGRNLEAGGDKIPLVEFRGFCTEWGRPAVSIPQRQLHLPGVQVRQGPGSEAAG